MTTSAEQFSLQQIASNLSAHPAHDSNNSNSLTIIGSAHSAGDPNISTEQTILGDLSTSGIVRLDGVIEGNIYCTSLIIMVNGRVNGGIVANQEVIVQGKVTGSIRSPSVMLQSSAKVEGDILYQRIGIEMGARHDGMLHRTEDEHVSSEPNSPTPGKQDNSEATCNTTKIVDQPKEPHFSNRPTVSNESQSPAAHRINGHRHPDEMDERQTKASSNRGEPDRRFSMYDDKQKRYREDVL